MLSSQLQKQLKSVGLNSGEIEGLVLAAISEDLDGGIDITSTATIPANQISIAEFRARKAGVVSGILVAAAVLEVQGITDYIICCGDGSWVEAGDVILEARGNTRSLLLTERTALNFLGHLSGISTLTKVWVDAIAGTSTKIRDTRKTMPLYRKLEKFAVRMGGGVNHRMSLSDAALIKDNHIVAAGSLSSAFNAIKALDPHVSIEVEVDTLEQLMEAIAVGADLVLLDNMSPTQCADAVALAAGRVRLEASGGIALESARTYAHTGVDYLAIGALTHSAVVLDIGLDLKVSE
jgi:nicotinate-nucleotide pyrophosphorylase (carboxylating)